MRVRMGRVAAATAASLAVVGLTTAAAATESVDGTLVEVSIDGHDGATSEFVLVASDGAITSVDPSVAAGVEPNTAVDATVAGDDVRAIRAVEAPVAATPVAAAHHAYVVAIVDEAASSPVALTDALELTGAAADYWVREARGAIPAFDTAGQATLTWTGSCSGDYHDLWSAAADLFPGVDFATGSNHLLVYSPTDCVYPYGGIASIGGSVGSGGMVHVAEDLESIVIHELGHNLSLGHANLAWDGGWAEYFGLFGPQAFSVGSLPPGGVDAAYRRYLDLPGWSETTLALDLAEASTRTVTLGATSSDVGTTAVMLEDEARGDTYFVEYRDGAGVDAGAFYAQNLQAGWWALALDDRAVFYRPGVVVTDAFLDDVTVLAREADGDLQASYGEGDVFVDDRGRFEVRVTEATATTATVEIVVGPAGPGEVDPITFSDVSEDAADPRFTAFFTEISWLAGQGISRGWANGDGTFAYRPFAPITRDAMAAFLYRLAAPEGYTPPAQSPFADVSTADPFYTEIAWLAEAEISTGWLEDGVRLYRPYAPITRDAMAAFLFRFGGEDSYEPEAVSPFVDVRVDQGFYREISWLADEEISRGWSTGAGQEYRPFSPITRDAMAAFLYRFAQP